jgi:KDO2-lipid IV(A) lauroyltransferase
LFSHTGLAITTLRMDALLYWPACLLLGLLQRLPLPLVARLGRAGGRLAWFLDRRHRRVALENLTACFAQERSPREIRALARENFCRLGENYACAVRTAAMTGDQIRQVLEVEGVDRLVPILDKAANVVAAIGHFGNFELYARVNQWVSGFQFATTYRALPQPRLNALLQRIRERSGCLYFERRIDAAALRSAMSTQRLMIGFLTDQHAGKRGLRLPFLGRDCSTGTAPAVFALRYACPLVVAICFRTDLARWRIEIGDPIPTRTAAGPRSVAEITRDVNLAIESAVRRDPANWFWVHRRWKPGRSRPVAASPGTDPVIPQPESAGRS